MAKRHPGDSFKLEQMAGMPSKFSRYCTECSKPIRKNWGHAQCRKCMSEMPV